MLLDLLSFSVEQCAGLERINGHGNRRHLLHFRFRCPGLPRNCEAEVRSRITPGGKCRSQGDQLFGFVVKGAGCQGGIHELLKLI